MSELFEQLTLSPEGFRMLLEEHAEVVMRRSETNAVYAEKVVQKTAAAYELIRNQSGAVESLIVAWDAQVRPVAEALFGRRLEDDVLEWGKEYEEYAPTIFEGVNARLRFVMNCPTVGPYFALDLLGEAA